MFPYKQVQKEVRRALDELNRLYEEFTRAMATIRKLDEAADRPEEDPAENIETVGLFRISCEPSVTGHQIPWYTSGFQ